MKKTISYHRLRAQQVIRIDLVHMKFTAVLQILRVLWAPSFFLQTSTTLLRRTLICWGNIFATRLPTPKYGLIEKVFFLALEELRSRKKDYHVNTDYFAISVMTIVDYRLKDLDLMMLAALKAWRLIRRMLSRVG